MGRLEIESQDSHNPSIAFFADLPKTHIAPVLHPSFVGAGCWFSWSVSKPEIQKAFQQKMPMDYLPRPPPHALKLTALRGTSMPLHSWRSGLGHFFGPMKRRNLDMDLSNDHISMELPFPNHNSHITSKCIYFYIYLSIYLPIYLSIYLSICVYVKFTGCNVVVHYLFWVKGL